MISTDRPQAEHHHVPFRRSIQLQFVLTYLGILAAVLVLLNSYPILVSQDLVFRSKQTSLQSQASVIANSLALSETLSAEHVTAYLDSLTSTDGTRITVVNHAGLILGDTDGATGFALFGELASALRGYDVFRSQYQSDAFHSWAAIPITYRGITIGAVRLFEVDTDQAQLLTNVQGNLRNISIIIAVITLLMSFFFSRALTRRLSDLLGAIRIVREGEYSHRVNPRGSDELSQLADEFNELTDRLQVTDEVRRRFVSDASHELKTPLASIRLLSDSILHTNGMDSETVNEFVTDIGNEADRLTRITEKLLALTRMDSNIAAPTHPVEMKTVILHVIHMLTHLAQEQDVTLEHHLTDHCHILATEDDLYQVAFNLVENAIKYNRPGGNVVVSLHGIGDLCILTVADTGVGIPQDDLPKIFERFYRVDKARSRAAGGTGLGLSIVRDTASQHGGTITVQANHPQGTQFQVAFPRYHGEEGDWA